MNSRFKKYFVTGLIVVVPLYITVYVLTLIISFVDSVFVFLPRPLQPDTYLPFHVPGLGIIFTALAVFLIGVLTQNFLGSRLLNLGEKVLGKIPVLRMIYNASKQFTETFFKQEGQGFRKVVLIEFPKQGMWSLGFQTGKPNEDMRRDTTKAEPSVCVFVPTAPNPTTGYLIVVPEKEIVSIDMKVEDAFKVIMTAGMVIPHGGTFSVDRK